MTKHIISKLSELQLLFLGFMLCAVLLTVRMKMTDSFHYLFLVWNIFLAAIPYGISFAIGGQKKLQKTWVMLALSGIWLLFLPNAPYLISDLQHLKYAPSDMVWYDVILLSAFAWYALYLLYLSMRDMQYHWSSKIKSPWSTFVIISIFFLCGFGIYLGRFLRWNSWDIIQNPIAVVSDIFIRIKHPIAYKQTWLVTFGYGIFVCIYYYCMRYTTYKKQLDAI